MSSTVEKLIDAYPAKQFVFATTKTEALNALDRIRLTIEEMEDFERFPEGAMGVILYAMLKAQSEICPDPSDFGYIEQGFATAIATSFEVICSEVEWFPGANRR